MIIIGKEFNLTGFNKRRINYLVNGALTPKQNDIINEIEQCIVNGEWTGVSNNTLREAVEHGIDLYEEVRRSDGKWHLMGMT